MFIGDSTCSESSSSPGHGDRGPLLLLLLLVSILRGDSNDAAVDDGIACPPVDAIIGAFDWPRLTLLAGPPVLLLLLLLLPLLGYEVEEDNFL